MTGEPHEGEEYHFPDGLHEVVFAVEQDRVLTVREYPRVSRFREAVEEAEHVGTNPHLADLSVDMFQDEEDVS